MFCVSELQSASEFLSMHTILSTLINNQYLCCLVV